MQADVGELARLDGGQRLGHAVDEGSMPMKPVRGLLRLARSDARRRRSRSPGAPCPRRRTARAGRRARAWTDRAQAAAAVCRTARPAAASRMALAAAEERAGFSLRHFHAYHRHARACPGHPDNMAQLCPSKRDGRDKPGLRRAYDRSHFRRKLTPLLERALELARPGRSAPRRSRRPSPARGRNGRRRRCGDRSAG